MFPFTIASKLFMMCDEILINYFFISVNTNKKISLKVSILIKPSVLVY